MPGRRRAALFGRRGRVVLDPDVTDRRQCSLHTSHCSCAIRADRARSRAIGLRTTKQPISLSGQQREQPVMTVAYLPVHALRESARALREQHASAFCLLVKRNIVLRIFSYRRCAASGPGAVGSRASVVAGPPIGPAPPADIISRAVWCRINTMSMSAIVSVNSHTHRQRASEFRLNKPHGLAMR
jgi:hypothetical protein